MSTTTLRTPPGKQGTEAARRTHWGWPQYLALLGVPVLFWDIWTVVAWATDGPHQITQFRQPGHPMAWWGARILEGIILVIALCVIVHLVKDCRKQRRIFTFDVMFCIAMGPLGFWASDVVNFFDPIIGYNSYFVNVNDPCGHMPFMVNPDCGRLPVPIILMPCLFAFGVLAGAMLLCRVAKKAEARWGPMSTAKVWLLLVGVGCIVCLVEPLLVIPLHGWDWPGAPWSIHIGSGAWRYPIFPEIFTFGLYLAIPAALRYFKNDRGQTVFERGLDKYGLRKARVITFMAVFFFMQWCIWIPGSGIDWVFSFFPVQWSSKLPLYMNNGLCDQPGVITGTRYGPCPGSPGFRMPFRGSLPGRSP